MGIESVKISKTFNKYTLLSPELDDSANQKLCVWTEKPFDPEDSMFWIEIGPEKGFEKQQQRIQLTIEEARLLHEFLSKFITTPPA